MRAALSARRHKLHGIVCIAWVGPPRLDVIVVLDTSMALLGPEVTKKACLFPLNLTWKKTPVLATSTINTPRRKTIPTYRMSERRDACLFHVAVYP
jgi:hypothetical protein